MITGNDVERMFTYHKPKGDQPDRYVELREAVKEVAHKVLDLTPVSAEQTLAIRHLEQAVFYMNASIARNE